jgi:ribosomal protein S18 acetylase RimI-like enzyme
VSVRPAVPDDAYTIARLRQAMYDERNTPPSPPSYREALYVYWYEMLESGQGVGWVAEDEGRIVGMAMLLLHDHPPRPGGPTRRGYVHNVYIAPEQRQRGHGRALMEAVIAFSREQGLQRLELRSSELGRVLYESVGFETAEYMILKLDA